MGAVKPLIPGLAFSALIALAVSFVSERLGGPAMLYALLFGMAFHFLGDDERMLPGIRFAGRTVLRVGVALLALRMTTGDVMTLGWPVVTLVVCGVIATIAVGWCIARVCRLSSDHAILSAGAVAICGASAALAIASILPNHADKERNTILTVAAVTALSTVAMVLYPVLVSYLGFNDLTAGVFLGATIHDVAQVVGAGYIVSEQAGEVSTLVKLMRVACLVPVVLFIALLMKRKGRASGRKEPLLPWFLVAFVVLVVVNSLGWVPAPVTNALTPVSAWCLLTAVAALGVRTSLEALVKVGPWPVTAMVLQTLFLALFVLAGLSLIN
ncbi:putative sulfate exporter family transporter [Marinihelvus fidelis]|uniref:Putative sulfate exporter family transporter n=1 Tax=Marinihelvus fidelis TaxID=2613842 RepID=A0A5N0T5H3_9GAMM|nr:putative sulfate exporter family transporter [Marinihelvus fidelis]KAA9130193.1 putative sulfate exporter family transporter [Marinihelvus fidelis]